MRTLQIKSLGKILANRKMLESKLKIKLEIKNNSLLIEGEELDEYVAEKVIDALELGFSAKIALLLLEEDYMLETINIRQNSKKNPKLIRARIIGAKRKTLDTIEQITGCYIVLHNNIVGVIGYSEDIRGVLQAISSLIKGAKWANIYAYLERLQGYKQPFVLKLKKAAKGKE